LRTGIHNKNSLTGKKKHADKKVRGQITGVLEIQKRKLGSNIERQRTFERGLKRKVESLRLKDSSNPGLVQGAGRVIGRPKHLRGRIMGKKRIHSGLIGESGHGSLYRDGKRGKGKGKKPNPATTANQKRLFKGGERGVKKNLPT